MPRLCLGGPKKPLGPSHPPTSSEKKATVRFRPDRPRGGKPGEVELLVTQASSEMRSRLFLNAVSQQNDFSTRISDPT